MQIRILLLLSLFHLFLIEQVGISKNKHKGPHDKVGQLQLLHAVGEFRTYHPWSINIITAFYYYLWSATNTSHTKQGGEGTSKPNSVEPYNF